MDKKAQVLIISLWILVILTILAISIGHRVSLGLRLSQYQKDKLRAYYLAKAGVNRAITELEKDTNSYDALTESWADNKEVFEKISLNENQNEFATVSYTLKENGREESKFGVIDEERKININTMPQGLLEILLDKVGIINSSELANNICAWRGDTGIEIPDYRDLGYPNKADKFTNIEEPILVKGMKDIDSKIYEELKSLITVWRNGKVNINTASIEILDLLIEYCQKQLQKQNISENEPGDLAERIIQARPTSNVNELETKLKSQGELTSGQTNILNELYNLIGFKSSCFYINSNGKINNRLNSIIYCIFDRTDKKIVYWHEG